MIVDGEGIGISSKHLLSFISEGTRLQKKRSKLCLLLPMGLLPACWRFAEACKQKGAECRCQSYLLLCPWVFWCYSFPGWILEAASVISEDARETWPVLRTNLSQVSWGWSRGFYLRAQAVSPLVEWPKVIFPMRRAQGVDGRPRGCAERSRLLFWHVIPNTFKETISLHLHKRRWLS